MLTFPNFEAFSANESPAIPEPNTRKSVLFFIGYIVKKKVNIQIDLMVFTPSSFSARNPCSHP
jgi:hypothetical protein